MVTGIEIRVDSMESGRDSKAELLVSIQTRIDSLKSCRNEYSSEGDREAVADMNLLIDNLVQMQDAVRDMKVILV